MKCKHCKNQVPDGSIFCNYCGERLIKPKREKEKEISVPKARKLPSGTWFIELQIGGKRHSVSASTEALCTAKARALKAGLIEEQKRAKPSPTLYELIDRYIAARSDVLSPSTIRGYRTIQRNRFRDEMEVPVQSIMDWQTVVNKEARLTGEKTLKNAWLFVCSVLKEAGQPVPSVKLPTVPKADRPWLDHMQIPLFLDAVRGQPCELAALLGLHGLRRSEIFGLRKRDIDLDRKIIRVDGSVVMDERHQFVGKSTAKNETSQRVVPIMIPALIPLLESAVKGNADDRLVQGHPNVMYKQINRVCAAAGLPCVGVHGLRHSFASLAYHLGLSEYETMEIGGWSDYATMRKRYTHLSALSRAEAGNRISEWFQNPNENPNEKKKP